MAALPAGVNKTPIKDVNSGPPQAAKSVSPCRVGPAFAQVMVRKAIRVRQIGAKDIRYHLKVLMLVLFLKRKDPSFACSS